jgi:aspartyl-tRNA(Asn)/glutamyl-tRNA(Gln) amidotransferase subunit B
MEKGQMRVEVNISLSEVQEGSDELSLSNPRIEIKNLNSFKAVKNATEYEIERQTKLLKEGKRIDRETRGWDANQGKTLSQRKKEEAHDYRYLPEPDLPPLIFTDQEIEEIKKEMPELPRKKREIYKDLQIKKQDIKFFVENIKIGRFFEEVIAQLKDESKETIQLAANYITSDLKGLLNQSKKQGIKFSSQDFIEFILLIEKGEISSKIAKKVLEEMTETGKNPSLIIKEKNLSKIDDKNKIEDRIKEVLKENQNAVNDFQSGNKNALQFLIGKTMQATKGRANIATVKKILKDKLN